MLLVIVQDLDVSRTGRRPAEADAALIAHADTALPGAVTNERGRHALARESRTLRRAPGAVLSEAPYAELPEQGLTIVPLHYAGTLFGRPTDR